MNLISHIKIWKDFARENGNWQIINILSDSGHAVPQFDNQNRITSSFAFKSDTGQMQTFDAV